MINGQEERIAGTGSLVQGGGGHDTAVIHGSAGDDTIVVDPDSATVTISGLTITLKNIEEITVFGEGGNDVAHFNDSVGDDTFLATPIYAAISGEGFHHRVHNFAEVHANSVAGGDDEARFYDSPGDDTYVATPSNATLRGDGFYNEAGHFAAVHAFATAGGDDEARFYDSPDDDQYVATPTHAAMFADGFYNRGKFFERTRAYATAGGTDVAKFYDSPGDDTFVATPTDAALFNPDYEEEYTAGFHNSAEFFEGAHAYATAGGTDEARLYDSPGDDTFHAAPQYGALYRPGAYYNRAKYFDGVHAFATAGGNDTARFEDYDPTDKYHATDEAIAIYRPKQYYNRAKYFEQVYEDLSSSGANSGGGPIGSGTSAVMLKYPPVRVVELPSVSESGSVVFGGTTMSTTSQGHLGSGVFLRDSGSRDLIINPGGTLALRDGAIINTTDLYSGTLATTGTLRVGSAGTLTSETDSTSTIDVQPGIIYDDDSVEVHLFLAAPGYTAGRLKSDYQEIVALLASGKWNMSSEELLEEGPNGEPALGLADRSEGDFTGDGGFTSADITALVAAGMWNQNSTPPSEQGDSATADLIVVPGEGLYIETNGAHISSYQITSASGSFNGDSAANLGMFKVDDESTIAGGMGFILTGRHFLGDVIGDMAVAGDISGVYTIDGVPGAHGFNVVQVGRGSP